MAACAAYLTESGRTHISFRYKVFHHELRFRPYKVGNLSFLLRFLLPFPLLLYLKEKSVP
jgi:hypothetical protein